MKTLNEFNACGEEIEARLLLKTSPIAIKMLTTKTDIPQGTMRPLKDTRSHLDLCQAFAISRRERKAVAMLKEDHWCYVPVIAQGLAEPPDFYLEGNMEFPARVADQQAAKDLAKNFPRLEYKKYIGMVSAPLGAGAGYSQLAPAMKNEHSLPGPYVKMGKMIGMDVHE